MDSASIAMVLTSFVCLQFYFTIYFHTSQDGNVHDFAHLFLCKITNEIYFSLLNETVTCIFLAIIVKLGK